MEMPTAVPDRQRKLRLLISPPQLVFAKWERFDLIMDLDSKYQTEAVVQE